MTVATSRFAWYNVKIPHTGDTMMPNSGFSIVIPAFNEEAGLIPALQGLMDQMSADGLSPALILVDDGSSDATWERMLEAKSMFPGVVCVKLSRNFGKEAAIFAGVEKVRTPRCLVMDADMQHPPSVIKELIGCMDRTGADIVEGVKTDRGRESLGYKLFARSFYWLLRLLSGIDLGNSSDFKLLSAKVIGAVNRFRESAVFFRGLIQWSGFSRETVPFSVAERGGGASSFSGIKRARFAVNSILSYTGKPLYLTVAAGFIFLLGAIALGIQTLVMFFLGHAVSGFTTVILLNLIIGSLVMLSLGIIGAYISRIYEEVKGRPRYLVSEYAEDKPDE
jgi:dolichol-phosphate mannosyltransferase